MNLQNRGYVPTIHGLNDNNGYGLTARKQNKNAKYGDIEREYYQDLLDTETIWYQQLYLMATSMFEWHNLPGELTSQYIERVLNEQGHLCWYFSEQEGGVTASGGTPSGEMNKFWMPKSYTLLQPDSGGLETVELSNSFNTTDESLGVLMLNNDLMMPEVTKINYWAHQLAEAEMTIKQNLRAQAQPYFITANENNKFSLATLFKKVYYGEPYVIAKKGLTQDDIKVLNTHTPYIADKNRDEFAKRHSMALTMLGVQNLNNTKAQRMIVDEANANNGQIELAAEIKLKGRQEACRLINERWGKYLDEPVSVTLRDNVQYDMRPKGLDTNELEVEADGELYD